MTYEIYRYIFLGGAILAAIMLVVSVIVFFLLKIPTVIGDLTGANARKAIENIRNQNESTGDKTYRSSKVNRERGKLTEKISPSGRIRNDSGYSSNCAMQTEKIGISQPEKEKARNKSTSASETTVLVQEEHVNETVVLDSVMVGSVFAIEYEITYIHTDEIIA